MSVTEVVAGVSYTFGPYRLDPEQATLFREGEPIPLTPKVFDTLRVLVENAGRLLSRQELLEEVWPDSIVVDGTLSQNIWVLRTALGEDEETKDIETVPRRGYRFIAAVQRIAPEPAALDNFVDLPGSPCDDAACRKQGPSDDASWRSPRPS